jgi:prevent-host-death family protein
MADTTEIRASDLRQNLAEVLNETAVHGRITYITRNGRRVAAIVPVPAAEQVEKRKV